MRGSGSSQARRQKPADLLVKAPAVDVDPLVALRDSFDRLGVQCTEKLGELAPAPMELTLKELVTGAIGDAFAGYGEAGIGAAFQAADRSSTVLMGSDRAFINCAVEAVFGSDGSEPASDVERAPTGIELRLAGAVFERILDGVRMAVFGADAAPLALEKIEAAAHLSSSTREEPHLVARFSLSALDRAGELCIAVPQAAVQEARQASATVAAGASTARDAGWSKRIGQEVQRTQVTLHAVLDERELTLGDISELRVGQIIPLKATPRSNVKVVCNDQTLFWCELGQTEGVYTLRIRDFPDDEQELINAITSQ